MADGEDIVAPVVQSVEQDIKVGPSDAHLEYLREVDELECGSGNSRVEFAEVLLWDAIVEEVIDFVFVASPEAHDRPELSTRRDIDGDVCVFCISCVDRGGEELDDGFEVQFVFDRGDVDLGFVATVGRDDSFHQCGD